MLNRPVTIISARKRGTTRFLIGSTPSTCSASSSSRILRAPRSAVIAVPATPARMIAVTNGANSRIDASTKKPPRRSIAPNRIRKLPAWRPGAPYPNATVEISSGNQQSLSANRNWFTNSPPYGYGGRIADKMVLPVRIIMSPTCSSRFLVGRNARSATARTTPSAPPVNRAPRASPLLRGERLRDRFWPGNREPSRTPPRKLRRKRACPWYVATALDARGAQGMRAGGAVLAAVAALAVSACGEPANQATSAFGQELRPGDAATFKWNVTAVQAGPYKIKWTVSAGLYGKAIAVDAAGRENPSGIFIGRVSNAAPHSTVNFKNGKTVERASSAEARSRIESTEPSSPSGRTSAVHVSSARQPSASLHTRE